MLPEAATCSHILMMPLLILTMNGDYQEWIRLGMECIDKGMYQKWINKNEAEIEVLKEKI